MTEILNTLSHRVYRDVDGRTLAIPSGGTYDGKADADNGQISANSAEGKAWTAAHSEGVDQDSITTDPLLDEVAKATALGGALATARLRDPHGDADDLIAEAEAAAAHTVEQIGQPIGTVETDPETGAVLDPDFVSAEPDPGHPPPEPAPDSAGTVTTSDAAGKGVVDPPPQPSPAPSYGEGVTFTSAAAENKADELVAAGTLDPSALVAGEGTGKDGAFKVDDVTAAASEG